MIDYATVGLADMAGAMRGYLRGLQNRFPWHPPTDVCERALEAVVALAGSDPVVDSLRPRSTPVLTIHDFAELDAAWPILVEKCRARSVTPPMCVDRHHRCAEIASSIDALTPVWRLGIELLESHVKK